MEKHESGYDYSYLHRTCENHVQQEVMENAKVPMLSYFYAIGRLTMWAAHHGQYKFVMICHDRFEGDLIANYYPSKDVVGKERPSYQIGAIWHKDSKEYSFHS